VHRAVGIPIIGVGGIMTIDDCLEFFVAGAAAVQVGTANFAEPVVSARLLAELPAALAEAGVARFADVVGTLAVPAPASCSEENAHAG
jgi:dihydroorotate dehydrogenase (NAD+) catalytic subunit